MKTWSYHKDGIVVLVTADDVEVARKLIESHYDIAVLNQELVPVVTHHRWTRVFYCKENDNVISQ